MTQPKRGRPAGSLKDGSRRVVLRVRVSAKELDFLERMVRAHGYSSLSDYVRATLFKNE